MMGYGLTLGWGTETIFGGFGDYGLANFKQVKSMGFTCVRLDGNAPQGVIEAAVSADLSVLLIIGPTYSASTETVEQFADAAQKFAVTWSAKGVSEYEVLNEPNYSGNWDSVGNLTNPSAYVALLKASYQAIKAADSKATVVLGSMAPYGAYSVPTGTWNGTAWASGTPPGSFAGAYDASNGNYADGGQVNPVAWLQTLYAAGAHGYFDVLGIHPYAFPALPGQAQDWNAWYQLYSPAGSIRALMQNYGDGSKPIWVTEFGVETASSPNNSTTFSVAFQGESDEDAVQQAVAHPSIERLMFFDLLDTTDDGTWGFYTSNGRAKASLATVLSAIGASTEVKMLAEV